jgi:hypothetical protein
MEAKGLEEFECAPIITFVFPVCCLAVDTADQSENLNCSLHWIMKCEHTALWIDTCLIFYL